MEVSHKTKNRTTIWLSNSTPGYISEKSKTLIQKGTCTQMFIAALFTIAKDMKTTCLATVKWIKKMWYIYNGILLSHKKEWNFAICSNVNEFGGNYANWN